MLGKASRFTSRTKFSLKFLRDWHVNAKSILRAVVPNHVIISMYARQIAIKKRAENR